MRKASGVVVFFLFLLCYSLTTPEYIADTTRFASDAVGHAQGHRTQFWEFGHLLWRPWAYVGHVLLGPSYRRWFGDTDLQDTVRFLMQTNFVCAAGVLLVLLSVMKRVAETWISILVLLAMSCATSFVNYSHAGAPYVSALLFSTVTLLLSIRAVEDPARGLRWAVCAGASFAIAGALWFPYMFTGLGMLAVLWWWPSSQPESPGADRPARYRLLIGFLSSLGALALLLFGLGAVSKGIGNVRQFAQWIQESDNGWSQSRTAMRAVTGLPRAVWAFGEDTVQLKRWLFHDPYNPASPKELLMSLGAKLAVFYLALLALLLVLWKERRPLFLQILAASVPLVLFAIFLFEPSSAERFLPLFPFVYAGGAAALSQARRYRVAAICMIVLLAGTTVANLAEYWKYSANSRLEEMLRRSDNLSGAVRPGRTLVYVLSFNDDLYRIPPLKPLDSRFGRLPYRVTDAVEIASRRIGFWRAEFAERVLKEWEGQGEVWISERLLAQRPEPHWRWVEGDDARIRWVDLPATFAQFESDSSVLAGRDGFLRIAQSEANRERLIKLLR